MGQIELKYPSENNIEASTYYAAAYGLVVLPRSGGIFLGRLRLIEVNARVAWAWDKMLGSSPALKWTPPGPLMGSPQRSRVGLSPTLPHCRDYSTHLPMRIGGRNRRLGKHGDRKIGFEICYRDEARINPG